MGWLSERKGGRPGGNPEQTRRTNRHLLRKIVAIVRPSGNAFAADRVRFECGHEGRAWGGVRGRCRQCPAREGAS